MLLFTANNAVGIPVNIIVSVVESLQPFAFVTTSLTVYAPVVLNVFVGLIAVDVVPSPKSQTLLIAPVDALVNASVKLLVQLVAPVCVKVAVGLAFTVTDVVVESLQPPVFVTNNFTV